MSVSRFYLLLAGQWKLLELCRALTYCNRDILMLSHPFDNMPVEKQQEIFKYLKSIIINTKKIVIISTTSETTAQFADNVYMLKKGQIYTENRSNMIDFENIDNDMNNEIYDDSLNDDINTNNMNFDSEMNYGDQSNGDFASISNRNREEFLNSGNINANFNKFENTQRAGSYDTRRQDGLNVPFRNADIL